MGEFMRRVLRGERGLYLQWLAILLVMAVGVFAWMSLSGCGNDGGGGGCGNGGSTSSWSTDLVNGPYAAVGAGLGGAGQSQAVQVWSIARWLDFPNDTMTTAQCTDWMNLLRSEDAFLALRVPMATAAATEAASTPLLLEGDFAPLMQIYRYYPSATVYSATLQLRPERQHFLAAALPQAEGEEWLAMGVVPDAPACPAGMNMAAKNWSFAARIFLDLSGETDYCRGCILPFYVCYEGQTDPLASQAVALALALAGGRPGVTTYSGEGITCLGPQAVQLVTGVIWKLAGAGTDIVTPTQSIQFHHYIANRSGGSLTYNLTTESNLGVTWRIYGGTSTAPNMSQLITPPMTVARDEFKHFWAISDPLPANTAHGPYSLRLTAAPVSAPTDVQWTGDMIWVGGWVAPSPEPAMHHLYLPVMFKSWKK